MSNGEIIPKELGQELIQNFVVTHPTAIKAHSFDKSLLLELLESPETVGMRIYYAYENGAPCLVLVAMDSDGNDLADNPVIERGKPCPPYCTQDGYFLNWPIT